MLNRTTQTVASLSARAFSTSLPSAKVGFLGLGNMGAHMARNLIKAGHEVVVYDVAAPAVDALKAAGAESADSPAAVAEQCSEFITMLPSSPHVQQVYVDGGVIDAAPDNALMIDCSTISPEVSRSVSAKATERGLRMVDAPVSGGVGGAEAATLTFMVGTPSQEDFESSKAILSHMGKNIVHCGDHGTGQIAKLCNNLLLGISMSGVAEAMALGSRLGIDSKTLAGILNTSSGRCWSSDTYNPCPGVLENVPSSKGYDGGFGSALILKDLGLAVEAAKSVHQPLPTGAAALQLYSLLTTLGYGHKDFSVVYQLLLDGAKEVSK